MIQTMCFDINDDIFAFDLLRKAIFILGDRILQMIVKFASLIQMISIQLWFKVIEMSNKHTWSVSRYYATKKDKMIFKSIHNVYTLLQDLEI